MRGSPGKVLRTRMAQPSGRHQALRLTFLREFQLSSSLGMGISGLNSRVEFSAGYSTLFPSQLAQAELGCPFRYLLLTSCQEARGNSRLP